MRSLADTQREFYREGRFADVFVSLRRAPRSLETRLRTLPGVLRVETRVASAALIDVAGFADPVAAQVLSLPEGRGGLNRLYLRAGRLPEGEREIAVNEAFAEAHGLRPGDALRVNLSGTVRSLRITGIALSPEFVYLIRPGDMFPDFKRYGVLWMAREPLEAAENMDGAFNSALLSLQPGARVQPLVEALDRMLEPYGSSGAIGRSDQTSHRYLSEEMTQLRAQANVLPAIFLGVAAFLLYVVMLRLLQQERSQIAVLKAFGYRGWEVALHYLQLSGAIVLAGALLGIAAGAWLGHAMSELYAQFFRFPYLRYRLDADVAASAVAISAGAALLGAGLAVRRAARLPPAQGMRPEPPPRFREGFFERSRLRRWLLPTTRMIVRNILRQPLKSALTVLGIALAAGIVVTGRFSEDAVSFLIDVQFQRAFRADLSVSFDEAKAEAALHELAALPGVHAVEAYRAVPARLSHGHLGQRIALQGLDPGARLNRLLDRKLQPIQLPPRGLMLTDHLAAKLGLEPGDAVGIEVLDGERPRLRVALAGVTREFTGYGAYMDRAALNALLQEGDVVSGAHLGVDDGALDTLYARLEQMPGVIGVMNRRVAMKSFEETLAGNMLIFALINLILASTIAVGVVYNSMRVAFSERARE
ncbi:MAG: ABC transporter permease, partial [Gammaproteobacteria bacterium]